MKHLEDFENELLTLLDAYNSLGNEELVTNLETIYGIDGFESLSTTSKPKPYQQFLNKLILERRILQYNDALERRKSELRNIEFETIYDEPANSVSFEEDGPELYKKYALDEYNLSEYEWDWLMEQRNETS